MIFNYWQYLTITDKKTPSCRLMQRLCDFAEHRFGLVKHLDEGDKEFNLSLLIHFHGKMFWAVAHKLELNEITDNYYAIGSGAHYALGAFELGASVSEAIRAATKWDQHTGGEIITLLN